MIYLFINRTLLELIPDPDLFTPSPETYEIYTFKN